MLSESIYVSSYGSRFFKLFQRGAQHSVLRVNKCLSTLPEEATTKNEKSDSENNSFDNFRFKYQDFLPSPNLKWRNLVREKLERRDMLRRRNIINIPEFYVGSLMAVTTSDQHASGKTTRFVGICIMKYAKGLSSAFILRNIVEQQGVEIMYKVYSPVIQKIEVLRLEKRLDDELFYLRDAPNEYSTVPFDMQAEYRDEKMPVPTNMIKVKLNPRPWLQRYERMNLKGVELPKLEQRFYDAAKKLETPWVEYDLVDKYRKTIPEEEQRHIFNEIFDSLKHLESKQKTEKRKKTFEKSKKTPSVF